MFAVHEGFHLPVGDLVGPVSDREDHGGAALVYVDFVDEDVNEEPRSVGVAVRPVDELREERPHLGLIDQLLAVEALAGDEHVKLPQALLAFHDRVPHGGGWHALGDAVHELPAPPEHVLALGGVGLLHVRQRCGVAEHALDHGIHGPAVAQHVLHALDDGILDLARWHAQAAVARLRHAAVVGVLPAVLARAAHARHRPAAAQAPQLAREQVLARVPAAPAPLPLPHDLLGHVVDLLRDHRGHAALDGDARVPVDARVGVVLEDLRYRVAREGVAPRGACAALRRPALDLDDRLAADVAPEELAHQRGLGLVDDVAVLLVGAVSEDPPAARLAAGGVLRDAVADQHAQVARVVFGEKLVEALVQEPVWGVLGLALAHAHDADARVAQLALVPAADLDVAGEAVVLVDDEHIVGASDAVRHAALEGGALVVGASHGEVGVHLALRPSLAPDQLGAAIDLYLDGLVALAVA